MVDWGVDFTTSPARLSPGPATYRAPPSGSLTRVIVKFPSRSNLTRVSTYSDQERNPNPLALLRAATWVESSILTEVVFLSTNHYSPMALIDKIKHQKGLPCPQVFTQKDQIVPCYDSDSIHHRSNKAQVRNGKSGSYSED